MSVHWGSERDALADVAGTALEHAQDLPLLERARLLEHARRAINGLDGHPERGELRAWARELGPEAARSGSSA